MESDGESLAAGLHLVFGALDRISTITLHNPVQDTVSEIIFILHRI